MRSVLGASFVAVLVLACAVPASAQLVAPVTDNFDVGTGGFQLAGWVTDPPSILGSEWKCDALPATVDGAPSFLSGVASLNFNDDTAYFNDEFGSATSPEIDVTSLGGSVVLRFACNYDTESSGYFWDIRDLDVLNGATDAVLGTHTLGSDGTGTLLCAAQGTWHTHVVDITAMVGAVPTIKIRFNFTADFSVDGFAGWFVDDFAITCADAIPPSTPTLLSPADATCTSWPITFDWTDSTDTTPCGAGIILGYNWQIDTTAAFAAPVTFFVGPSTIVVAGPPGVFFWRVQAMDGAGTLGAFSPAFTFTAEIAAAPTAPDTLFVNESSQGAQTGDGGFVDPVVDEQPVFSAIFRDANCGGNAASLRFQVSDDPTFAVVNFDSGVVGIAGPVPKDTRCPDLSIPVNLQRDTVYYWRILFVDDTGLTGPFSLAQSFRIGDDFEFGVRPGSSNHSRKCFVATAAWGGVTPEVESLMAWRAGVAEPSAAGRSFSRAYAAAGPAAARRLPNAATRAALTPLAAAAKSPQLAGLAGVLLLAALLASARRRLG
ncbi:MAG: hypothetical protein HYY18_15090 [Planctomycetes bacterium]|nr:hypothetical protein [Planctomycetota bacterium]